MEDMYCNGEPVAARWPMWLAGCLASALHCFRMRPGHTAELGQFVSSSLFIAEALRSMCCPWKRPQRSRRACPTCGTLRDTA